MMTGREAVYYQAVARRDQQLKDLRDQRNEMLVHHPEAIRCLQKLDDTTGQFLTWNRSQLQVLWEDLLSKQCGSDMTLCTPEIKADVWLVLSGIMWAVFEAIHKLRSRARAMTDVTDPGRFNATFLFTACRECALLESIMKHQLREWDPAGAAIMQYLFNNSISLTLYRSLEARVESQEEELAKIKRADKVKEGQITELQKFMKASKK